jgi:hypothetical protein
MMAKVAIAAIAAIMEIMEIMAIAVKIHPFNHLAPRRFGQ